VSKNQIFHDQGLISIPASSLGPINISTLHHLRSLHFIVTFRNLSPPKKPFAQTLYLLHQISNNNTLEKITLECHCITRSPHDREKSLTKLWRPLDTALSATKSDSGEPIFGNLKEVEIVLSASTIHPAEICRLTLGKGEFLPSVEARRVMVTVKVDKRGEERGLLDRLRQM
jgi:hypothetical protein